MKVRAALVIVLGLVGCGPTIGDPCTTATECLNRLCLTAGMPGGYCSSACTLGDPNSCPAGSVCVRDLPSVGVNGCLRACNGAGDCRSGYLCQTARGSAVKVCVGPNGL